MILILPLTPSIKRMVRRSTKPEWQKRIARERIDKLFEQAKDSVRDPSLSRRYVQLARKIAMRYNLRIPSEYKRSFCKECNSYLVPGLNSRVRASPSHESVTVTCLECGNVSRFPYRREKRSKA